MLLLHHALGPRIYVGFGIIWLARQHQQHGTCRYVLLCAPNTRSDQKPYRPWLQSDRNFFSLKTHQDIDASLQAYEHLLTGSMGMTSADNPNRNLAD